MIERINSQSITVLPTSKPTQRQKDISLKITEEQPKSADYLFNPQLAEKISRSRESLTSEMKIIEETKEQKQQDPSEVRQQTDSSTHYDTLSILKRSLTRMKSLLYQMASATAGNSEQMEKLQSALVDELRGYRRAFRGVDVSINQPDLSSLENLDVSEQVQKAIASATEASDAVNAVERAESEADSALRASGEEAGKESRTEAALKTAEQNLTAAENTYYPQDVLSRARNVAEMLQRESGATNAQQSLRPEEVYKLLDFGQ